jgi:hypothetical protein
MHQPFGAPRTPSLNKKKSFRILDSPIAILLLLLNKLLQNPNLT